MLGKTPAKAKKYCASMKKLLTLFTMPLCCHAAIAQQSAIAINQVGFYPYGPKTAVVMNNNTANSFYILDATKGDTVYTGALQAQQHSQYSSNTTNLADFSAFTKPGRYVLSVPGVQASYTFNINNNVFSNIDASLLKGFYYQRSAMALDEQYAGKWHRPAGHPDTAVLVHPSAATATRPAGTIISTPGGWYDAGDYNKYIVNSGISTSTLLSAYEDFPKQFDGLVTNIPESNNKVPDLLDEALYNIRWMLTMQDPADGGVYNKCTNAAFDGMVMPGVTKLPRYVVAKGTAAALDFAAVMAQAARVYGKYKKQLPGLADSCRVAAVKAWKWAVANPALAYDQDAMNKQFEPKITTGGYGDRQFGDEWFWAACELVMNTGEEEYLQVVLKTVNEPLDIPSWSSVHTLGYFTLIRNHDKTKLAPQAINYNNITAKLEAYADGLLAGGNKAFGTVMGQSKGDYIWGSSAVAANQGMLLLMAYNYVHSKKYLDGAISNLDYLLGRNATGYCFVTGAGTKSTMHPHHRPSVADGITEPVPGLLAGGPNPGMQDHTKYLFTEPETAYNDDDQAYASNEIAINWNAPAVYLVNGVEAERYKAGYAKSK